jgi:regulator of replication initiation timing
MNPADSSAELNDALAKLETALLTPVVAGELESWARTVQDAITLLALRLPDYLQSVLHRQYAEIARTDPELLFRVQQLIEEDRHVVIEQDAFRMRVGEFVKRAKEVSKDEVRLTAERTKLEQEGIALIVKIKRQRAAADTWFAEAAYRDRGPVD